jgi:signal transduction histidine kinase
MRIRHRLNLMAVATIDAAALFAITLWWTSDRIGNAVRQGQTIDEVTRGVFELTMLTNDFLLHHTPRAQVQWENRSNSLRRLMTRLEGGNDGDRTLLKSIAASLKDMQGLFAQVRAIHQGGASTAAEAQRIGSREQLIVGLIGSKAQAMVESAVRLKAAANARLAAAERRGTGVLLFAGGSMTTAMLFVIVATNRRIMTGVTKLSAGAAIIGAGNLEHRIGHQTNDEMGDLADTIDDMTDRLRRTTVTRDTLAEEVVVRRKAQEDLIEAADALQQSNRDLEQFAYVASHDLQEPLRTVASYLQLVKKRYAGRLDSDADEFIDFAVDGAGRMQQIIRDLLVYSRIGTQGKSFSAVDCNEALRDVMHNLKADVIRQEAEVTHDPLPRVSGDRVQMARLLQNLISNAIKYRSDARPKVHVSARRSGDEWILSVTDNGIGIAPEHADRIFGMFQRLHARDEYSGTGIGLAICKRIAGRHGGRIWLESEPGRGATFSFSIPAPVPAETSTPLEGVGAGGG